MDSATAQFAGPQYIPIAALDPSTSPPQDRSIRAVVSLLWPYSSISQVTALLLVEPDFRLRGKRGQVRVQFSGPAASALAAEHIRIGDTLELKLAGPIWTSDSTHLKTPGRSVEADLLFRRQLDLKVERDGVQVISICINRPPSPLSTSTATPARVPLRTLHQSPLTREKGRSSDSPFRLSLEAHTLPLDPFADDYELEERPRKRIRTSGLWRYERPSQDAPRPDTVENGVTTAHAASQLDVSADMDEALVVEQQDFVPSTVDASIKSGLDEVPEGEKPAPGGEQPTLRADQPARRAEQPAPEDALPGVEKIQSFAESDDVSQALQDAQAYKQQRMDVQRTAHLRLPRIETTTLPNSPAQSVLSISPVTPSSPRLRPVESAVLEKVSPLAPIGLDLNNEIAIEQNQPALADEVHHVETQQNSYTIVRPSQSPITQLLRPPSENDEPPQYDMSREIITNDGSQDRVPGPSGTFPLAVAETLAQQPFSRTRIIQDTYQTQSDVSMSDTREDIDSPPVTPIAAPPATTTSGEIHASYAEHPEDSGRQPDRGLISVVSRLTPPDVVAINKLADTSTPVPMLDRTPTPPSGMTFMSPSDRSPQLSIPRPSGVVVIDLSSDDGDSGEQVLKEESAQPSQQNWSAPMTSTQASGLVDRLFGSQPTPFRDTISSSQMTTGSNWTDKTFVPNSEADATDLERQSSREPTPAMSSEREFSPTPTPLEGPHSPTQFRASQPPHEAFIEPRPASYSTNTPVRRYPETAVFTPKRPSSAVSPITSPYPPIEPNLELSEQTAPFPNEVSSTPIQKEVTLTGSPTTPPSSSQPYIEPHKPFQKSGSGTEETMVKLDLERRPRSKSPASAHRINDSAKINQSTLEKTFESTPRFEVENQNESVQNELVLASGSPRAELDEIAASISLVGTEKHVSQPSSIDDDDPLYRKPTPPPAPLLYPPPSEPPRGQEQISLRFEQITPEASQQEEEDLLETLRLPGHRVDQILDGRLPLTPAPSAIPPDMVDGKDADKTLKPAFEDPTPGKKPETSEHIMTAEVLPQMDGTLDTEVLPNIELRVGGSIHEEPDNHKRTSAVPQAISAWFTSGGDLSTTPRKPKLQSARQHSVSLGPTSSIKKPLNVGFAFAPSPAVIDLYTASGANDRPTSTLMNGHGPALTDAGPASGDSETLKQPLSTSSSSFDDGFRTTLSYYAPLSSLQIRLNTASQSSEGNTVDIFAIVASPTSVPERAKNGPKDYHTVLHVTDKSIGQDKIQVQIFRPYKYSLPLAAVGDVVMFRNFVVKSRAHRPFLLSCETSAWHVWRYSQNSAKEECRGPPVEVGDQERQRAQELRSMVM